MDKLKNTRWVRNGAEQWRHHLGEVRAHSIFFTLHNRRQGQCKAALHLLPRVSYLAYTAFALCFLLVFWADSGSCCSNYDIFANVDEGTG